MKNLWALILILLGMGGLLTTGIEARNAFSCLLLGLSFACLISGTLLHLAGVKYTRR